MPVRPPDLLSFRNRARRAQELAAIPSNLAGVFLAIESLCDTQDRLLKSDQPLDELSKKNPPLFWQERTVDHRWQASLSTLLRALEVGPEPLEGIRTLLNAMSADDIERQAVALTSGDFDSIDRNINIPIVAALQLEQMPQAAQLPAHFYESASSNELCPACGSQPVACILCNGGDANGLRYACCPLCGVQWNRVRSHCLICHSGEHVAYFSHPQFLGIRAETCDHCMVYIKVLNLEVAPNMDPLVDDIASLGLDVLMAEEGYGRIGFNPFLIPGPKLS